MPLSRSLFYIFLLGLFAFFIGSIPAFAIGIDATSYTSQYLDWDMDQNSTMDRINWRPGQTLVSDPVNIPAGGGAVTGYIWGETAGWINLGAENLTLTCNGTTGYLAGYAWAGDGAGWINFDPSNANSGNGVMISAGGELNGYAWSSGAGGYINFACPGANTCVKTAAPVCTTPTTGGGDDIDEGDDPYVRFVHSSYVVNESAGTVVIQVERTGPTDDLITVEVHTANGSAKSGNDYATHSQIVTFYPGETLYSITINIIDDTLVEGNEDFVAELSDPDGAELANPSVATITIVDNENNFPPDPLTCSITAAPKNIKAGENVLLSWVSNSTASGILTPGNISISSVASGYTNVSPSVDTTYILTLATGENCTEIVKVNKCQGWWDVIYPECWPKGDPETPETTCAANDPSCVTSCPNGDCVTGDDEDDDDTTTGGTCEWWETGCWPQNDPRFRVLKALNIAGLIAAAVGSIPAALRVWNLILAFLGFRKKHRDWGTVYDSRTKQPLDPAYVTLYDVNGVEVANSITDLDGRYGFLVDPGIYTMTAQKTNYTFPSQVLGGRDHDELYNNLYFGGTVEVKHREEVITRNIPMDSKTSDWNEQAKNERGLHSFYSRHDLLISRITTGLFILGFISTILAVIIAPIVFNFVILALYIIMIILQAVGIHPRKYGFIKDRITGKALPFAIIRIFSPELSKEVSHRVADAYGKYYALVPRGEYYVTIETKNPDGTYTHAYTSRTINARGGVIKKTFEV